MVKFFNQRKNQKKKPNKKPFIRRKIFKRIISNKRRSHYCLNISIVNWASIFLQQFSFPKEGEFYKKFFKILKKLKFNENEFIEWILYLEYYINETKNNDLESFYYLGLLLKESFGINLIRNNDDIEEERMKQVKLIFEKKKINVIDFNKKFNFFSQYNQQNKNYCYDINSIIDFIFSSVSRNNQPIPENQDIQNNQDNNNGNETNNFIDNENIIFGAINDEPNNDFGERNISNIRIYGIDRYDDESLPNDDNFQKSDSSYENLQRAIFMNTIKNINK